MSRFGPCMCGDTHCGSCGPAQGFHRCPACGLWNDDENEKGEIGCVDPEKCQREVEAADRAGYEYEYYVVELPTRFAKDHGHPGVLNLDCDYGWCAVLERKVNFECSESKSR